MFARLARTRATLFVPATVLTDAARKCPEPFARCCASEVPVAGDGFRSRSTGCHVPGTRVGSLTLLAWFGVLCSRENAVLPTRTLRELSFLPWCHGLFYSLVPHSTFQRKH